jgi:hypothetical protein
VYKKILRPFVKNGFKYFVALLAHLADAGLLFLQYSGILAFTYSSRGLLFSSLLVCSDRKT